MQALREPEQDIQTDCAPVYTVSAETLPLHLSVLVWGEDKTKSHYTKAVIVETGWKEKGRGEQTFQETVPTENPNVSGLVHKACEKENYTS